MEEKVVKDVLTPGGEGASLGTTGPKDGEESPAGEALAVHTRKVTKPTEATGTEQGLNRDKTTGFAHRGIGDRAMRGVGDAQHVSGTSHLEGLKTTNVRGLRGPGLGPPEQGREDCGTKDRDFDFDRNVFPPIKRCSKGIEALVGLLETGRDFGFELRLKSEGAAKVFEGSEELFLLLALPLLLDVTLLLLLLGWGDNMLKGDATESDGGLTINVVGVDAEDFGFGLIDGEKEELSSTFEGEDKTLQTFGGMADNSHVICVEEDLKKEIKLAAANRSDAELAINSVTEGHTIRGVSKGNTNDVVKEDSKESRSKNTTLAYAVISEKGIRKTAVCTHRRVSVRV